MSASATRCCIVQVLGKDGVWRDVPGTMSTRMWCLGYLAALRDMLPHPAARVMEPRPGVLGWRAVEKIDAARGPHANGGVA